MSALVSSIAMVVALAIDWPTAPLPPDIGTSNATRWRVSSLGRAVALGSGVGVCPVGRVVSAPRGMIAVRCDLGDRALRSVATGVAGVDFPDALEANCVGEKGLCWMSPDELLVMVPEPR